MIVKLFLKDAKSNKFWFVQTKNLETIVTYGKVGTKPRTSVKNHKDKATMTKFVDAKILEKINKGYLSKDKKQKKNTVAKDIKPFKLKVNDFNKLCNYLLTDDIKKDDLLQFYFDFEEKHYFTVVNKNQLKTELSENEKKNKKLNYSVTDYNKRKKEYIKKNNFLEVTVKGEYGYLKMNKDWFFDVMESPKFEQIIKKMENKNIAPFAESGVIVIDIPSKLCNQVKKQVIAFGKKTAIDYHPHSNKKIRDLVHPALYPFISGVSKIKSKPKVETEKVDFWNRPYEKSKFQWLPSEFSIQGRKSKIETYVNNLPMNETKLYKNLEELFDLAIPQLERMWLYIQEMKLYNQDDAAYDLKIEKPKVKTTTPFENLQVIVKIVEMHTDKNEITEGAWHVEGMSHENIVMTAVAVLEQNNVKGVLNFKRRFTEKEVEYLYYNVHQDRHSYINDFIDDGLVPLGKYTTSKCKMILFPNSHIHKLDLIGGSKKGIRRVVVFWVVNPNKKIISTKNVEPQQKKIKKVQAKKYRLELMKERKYHKQSFNVREISLCEH